MPGLFYNPERSGTVAVKVSAAMLRLPFEGCSPDYIQNVCHGRCCHIKAHPQGTVVKVEPDQAKALSGRVKIIKLVLQTVDKKCVFHSTLGFCALHGTPDKPRSCIQSPFILTKKDTLIIRNRYRRLICFKAAPALPAYKAFRPALDLLFGQPEAQRICDHLTNGGGDLTAYMITARYQFNKAIAEEWLGWKT
jgi:hypothetical protein